VRVGPPGRLIVPRRARLRLRPKPYRLDVHPEGDLREGLAADVRRGLGERPRWLLAKYFYDERGSRLFERITRLPEYYQTRTELEILRREAPGNTHFFDLLGGFDICSHTLGNVGGADVQPACRHSVTKV